jgi:glycosyltransferase involved in cell wall biosynthesis
VHIGVSGWRLHGQRLGMGRYIEYQLKYWAPALQPAERVTVYVHEPFEPRSIGLPSTYSARVIRPKLSNALWENLLLPFGARDVDVLFGPSYTLPLTYRGRSVLVLHSVDEAAPGAHTMWHHLTYTQKYRFSARRATRVIATSASTAERAQEVYGIEKEKIDVVWHGVDDAFRPISDDRVLSGVRRQYFGVDRPYVLFVGGLSRRRNVPVLLEAFAEVKHQHKLPHGLLLFGPNRGGHPLQDICKRLGIADAVVQTDGRIASHHDLVPIYGAADTFVLPSISEGFSLTLAEAMACGVPVITVNTASLGEMAHGYGMTIAEPTVPLLADALSRVLTDRELRQRLSAGSLERAKLMRWDVSAHQTLHVLRRAATQ